VTRHLAGLLGTVLLVANTQMKNIPKVRQEELLAVKALMRNWTAHLAIIRAPSQNATPISPKGQSTGEEHVLL
jgi:hypothetical protein